MRGRFLFAMCGVSLAAMAGLARAQVIEPLEPVPPVPASPEAPPQPGQPLVIGKTVTDRPRPEVDPLGVKLGSFFLFPRIELDESYNDNIFATNSGKIEDWITTVVPSFDLVSNLPQNLFELSGGAAIGEYANHTSENFQDAFGAANARFDINNVQSVLAGARVDRLHEPRTAPDSPGNAAKPVDYMVYTGNLGFEQTKTTIGYEVDGITTRSEYSAPPAVGGGFIPQDDRNETGFEGAARVYYEFFPGYQAYVRGSGNSQNYDHAAGLRAIAPGTTVYIPSRDSTGWRGDVGARIDLTGITFIDIYGGYLSQTYNTFFGTIHGFDAGAQLVWNVTTLDTVKINGVRTVNNADAEIVGAAASAGYLASIGTVSIDHELLRNLLLNANAGYENDAWNHITRTDHVVSVGAGAKYLMMRNLYLGANWTLQRRDSSGAAAGIPYTQNIFMARISTQF